MPWGEAPANRPRESRAAVGRSWLAAFSPRPPLVERLACDWWRSSFASSGGEPGDESGRESGALVALIEVYRFGKQQAGRRRVGERHLAMAMDAAHQHENRKTDNEKS